MNQSVEKRIHEKRCFFLKITFVDISQMVRARLDVHTNLLPNTFTKKYPAFLELRVEKKPALIDFNFA